MLLFGVATSCLFVFAGTCVLALGTRRRSDALTAFAASALLTVVTLLKILLLAGWFRPGAIAASTGLLAAGGVVALRRVPVLRARAAASAAALRGGTRLPAPAVPLLVGVAVVYLYRSAMALRIPPMDMDSLWYHLVSVAAWVRTGRLAPSIEHLSHSWDLGWTVVSDTYPRDFELSASWFAVFSHSIDDVQLTQILYAGLMFAAVMGICRRLGVRPGLSVLAATSVVLAPAVDEQAYLMYADVARAAVPAAAWHLLLVALPERRRDADRAYTVRWLLMAGAVLGVAAGTKASNLYFVPAGLLAAFVLARVRAGRDEGEAGKAAPRPGTRRVLGLVGLGTLATGSFWYIVTWVRWGSPVWPVALGPFKGTMSATDMVDVQRPPAWQHMSDADVMVRSWWGAVARFGQRPWYAEFTGQLGLAWLFLMLPAILLVALAPFLRRPPDGRMRRIRVAYGVVVPFTLATLAAPGQWFSRYTIPLLVAGAVAFAVLVEAGLRRVPEVRPVRHRSLAPRLAVAALAVATAIGLVPGLRWSNFKPSEDPAHQTYRQVIQAMGKPAAVRDGYGVWGLYQGLNALPAGSRIGFCEEDTVRWYTPMILIGRHFERTLVDLGHCGDADGALASMNRLHVGYLYTSDGGPLVGSVSADSTPGFREVVTPSGADAAGTVVRVWQPV